MYWQYNVPTQPLDRRNDKPALIEIHLLNLKNHNLNRKHVITQICYGLEFYLSYKQGRYCTVLVVIKMFYFNYYYLLQMIHYLKPRNVPYCVNVFTPKVLMFFFSFFSILVWTMPKQYLKQLPHITSPTRVMCGLWPSNFYGVETFPKAHLVLNFSRQTMKQPISKTACKSLFVKNLFPNAFTGKENRDEYLLKQSYVSCNTSIRLCAKWKSSTW